MSATAVAYRSIDPLYQPALYDTDSRTALPSHLSTPFQQYDTPLRLSSPLPLAALLSDSLSFPDSSLPFDSLHDYYSLDPPLPLSHVDDSQQSSSSSSSGHSLSPTDSPPSLSPTSLNTPVDTPLAVTAPNVRRKRSERSSRDRLLRKRNKQRECDVDRRYRENTAFIQLQQLIREEEEEEKDDGPHSHSHSHSHSCHLTDTSKRHKADILQHSVELIQVLKRRVAQLTASSSSSSLSSAPKQLSPLTSSAVATHLRHSGLHSPMRAADHSTVCLILLDAPTNRIIDVTTRFLACTGWQRTHIVGRLWPQLTTGRQGGRRAVVGRAGEAVLVAGRGGVGLVASRQEPQYERSISLRQQLYGGQVDRIEAVWRAQMADGRLYEFQATSWVSEWSEERLEYGGSTGGGLKRQPYQAMSVVSGTEIVCVE